MKKKRKTNRDLLAVLDDKYIIKKIPDVFWLECCECKYTHLVIIDWANKQKTKVRIALVPESIPSTEAKRKVAGIKLIKSRSALKVSG